MTKSSIKQARCECNKWDRIDRSPDGTGLSYHYYQCSECYRVDYPMSEIKKLMEYAEKHQFMFVTDWILAWLYSGDGVPVSGVTVLQKQMFIIFKEFAVQNNIPSENPGFRAYKYGPYTERIDGAIDSLTSLGLIVSIGRMNTVKETFYLTAKGMNEGKVAFNKLTSEQQSKLRSMRRDLQQFNTQGIMTYVYKNYPEYTNKSIVFERTLHRKRYPNENLPYFFENPSDPLKVSSAGGDDE